ncbi:MAG TPA: Gfo/Idh/MocA family oxidoreductase [Planctomycetota bacterium]|nr:Gfo/Idh/MocA family oxidoreductase [Planctomycetota bacterium]
MSKFTRRTFLTGTVATAASLATWRRAYGANDAVRVAVVGCGGRGKAHIDEYSGTDKGGSPKVPGVRIVALCDCDEDHLNAEAGKLDKKGIKVDKYTDLRKLLEDKNIDAISIATPNHQHSLQAIWAMLAGKDVYCEKPISHNVWEGRKVVEVQKKTGRICATGTQCRSSVGLMEAIKWVQDGNLGKIQHVRGLCYKYRPSIGHVDGPQPIPKGLAGAGYDIWCGPAKTTQPLMRKNLHYDWHWVWDTGNGDLGNQGIHQMDIARWVLGEDKLSPRVFSVGGRFGYEDDGETPNTMFVFHDYKPAPLIFEVRGLPGKPPKEGEKPKMDEYKGAEIGVVAKCEHGNLVITSYEKAHVLDEDGKIVKEFKGGGNHFKNFIDAVNSRKQESLASPILQGHLSSALCHTGNISIRLGAKSTQEAIREKLKDNFDAQETFENMCMHLKVNRVDLGKTKATMGEFLTMDGVAETFSGNMDASKMLTREYRAPYSIPEKV